VVLVTKGMARVAIITNASIFAAPFIYLNITFPIGKMNDRILARY
jgi:hypothetical protein